MLTGGQPLHYGTGWDEPLLVGRTSAVDSQCSCLKPQCIRTSPTVHCLSVTCYSSRDLPEQYEDPRNPRWSIRMKATPDGPRTPQNQLLMQPTCPPACKRGGHRANSATSKMTAMETWVPSHHGSAIWVPEGRILPEAALITEEGFMIAGKIIDEVLNRILLGAALLEDVSCMQAGKIIDCS